MKHIFLLFLLSISIFSYSQSEIWGIKQQAGKNNGGFLFSIDSASNEIIEHLYFTNPKEQIKKSEIFYDSVLKCMFGISNQVLYKYDLVNRTTESKIVIEEVFGSFVKASNGYLYILGKTGIIKMNPNDMSMKKLGPLYGQFILPDSTMNFETEVGISFGLQKVSEDHFITANYTEDNSYHWYHSFIHSINTINDSVDLLYRTSFFPEQESLVPVGKFYPYNGLQYALFSINGVVALYALNTSTKEFSSVRTFPEIKISQNASPYVISTNGQIYGKTINSSNNKSLLYQYGIDSDQFQILSEIPNGNRQYNRMITDSNNDLYLLLDTIEELIIKTSMYQYNFETHHLDSLFCINGADWAYPSYDEYGPLVLFNNNVISFLDEQKELDNYFVSYNLEQKRLDTLAFLYHYLNYTDSIPLPTSFCGTKNGNLLLLNNREKKLYPWEYKFFISFSHFNPQTKELIRADEIELSNYCNNPQVYNINDEDYCISCSQNNVILKYHWSNNEITYIETPFSGEWFQKEDNSFIGVGENSVVYKFHFISEQFEELYTSSSDTTLDLACFNQDRGLYIYSESIEQFLFFDLNSNEMLTSSLHNQLNEQIENFRVEKLFTEGNHLFIIVTDLSPYSKKLFRYDLLNHELTYINMEENDYLPYFQFTENYAEDGFYMTNIDPDNKSSGFLKSIKNNCDTSVILDDFENKTSAYENVNEPTLKLMKTKKKPIHRWIGELSNDWYEAGNWALGILPNENSSVNIMNDAPFYPEMDTTVKMRDLYIYNDAKILLEKNAEVMVSGVFKNHGTLNMLADNDQRSSLIVQEEFIQKGIQKYIYCADTIKDKNLANPMKAVEKYVQPFYSEADYNENTFAFDAIQFYPHFSETCQAVQYTCQDTMIEFKGSFNHGSQNLPIPLLSEPELYPLPNPYPSSINWNKTDINSLTHQACYFYNEEDSSFSATVDGVGNHPPFIRPLEVFWVYGNGEESVQINESALIHEQDFAEEIPNRKVLSLQVTGAKKEDQTLIAFNDLASKNYDPQLDAFKFIKNENYPHIFTKSEDELLMINQYPDTTMMNLFVQMGEDGNMKIKLAENQGFDYLVLEDLIWHSRTDLLENDYQFDYFTSDGHYPFKLYFKPWVLEPIEEADIQMYYYPEFLVVKSRKQVKQADITFYDLAGRAVLEFSEQNFFHIEKPIQIPAGHYIVQLRSGDVVVNVKILVR